MGKREGGERGGAAGGEDPAHAERRQTTIGVRATLLRPSEPRRLCHGGAFWSRALTVSQGSRPAGAATRGATTWQLVAWHLVTSARE